MMHDAPLLLRPRSPLFAMTGIAAALAMTLSAVADDPDYNLFLDGVTGEAISDANFDVQHITVEAWMNVETVNLDPCCTFAGVLTWGRNGDASWEFGVVGVPAGGPIEYVYPFFKINWGKNESRSMLSSHAHFDIHTWKHVAATYDGETARIYVNGQLIDEEVWDVPISAGGEGAHMSVGNNFPGGNEYFGGLLDEVRVWDFARSAEELIKTMYRPLVGTDPGLVVYYDLNEGDGLTLNDRSGNGRDAELVADTRAGSGSAWMESTSPVDLMIGDVNEDGTVDVSDLLMVLAAWGPCDVCTEDLNNDGVVDVTDLLILLGNWAAPQTP
jgi:hypothetical protein